jgi:hypothetical protein
MESQAQTICPTCHAVNPPDAYFCSNCGKALKEKQLPITLSRQVGVYFVSIFLPPFGLWYAYKYFRQPGPQARRIAIVSTILTIASTVISIWYTAALLQTIMQSLSAINSVSNPGL